MGASEEETQRLAAEREVGVAVEAEAEAGRRGTRVGRTVAVPQAKHERVEDNEVEATAASERCAVEQKNERLALRWAEATGARECEAGKAVESPSKPGWGPQKWGPLKSVPVARSECRRVGVNVRRG